MPKKFIDKKKCVTFQLVHRSQQDPLVVDENAPQRVLLPVTPKESASDKEKRLEEQQKYGIYYDDDFDYLQHLKDRDDCALAWPHNADEQVEKMKENNAKLKLPSSVFASEVEEEVGMLNKAAPVSGPQLHLDPDLVAAMDDDFNYSDPENELEDNFLELADGLASDQDFGEEYNSDEERDEVYSMDTGSERSFREEETKSRFTNYSMTSSVMRRNEQLTLLDDRFEKMFEDYDDNEIGALDCDEIEGYVPNSDNILLQYAAEFKKERATEPLDKDENLRKLDLLDSDDETDSEDDFVRMKVEKKEKWDCESILTTYSDIYNHPKIIKEPSNKIQLDPITGIPKNALNGNRLTAKALNQLNEEQGIVEKKSTKSVGAKSVLSQLSILSIRPKDEQPEERRDRKRLLKQYKKTRRMEKKVNSMAFKEETKRQNQILINKRNNVQGNKIF